jgi:hypothetical protein
MSGLAQAARKGEQASAAAEGILVESLIEIEVLFPDASSCWSDAVENLAAPQHDDDGRNQGGDGQHTLQGSNSHDTLRFPTPRIRLFDSRNRRQSAAPVQSEVILRLWFAGHSR